MKPVILVDKPVGMTPLQAVYAFKKGHPEYTTATIGYAGRLDPLAEGLLLLLVNEENKKRKEYEALEKTYEFSMLLGVATDTYDVLGMVTKISPFSLSSNDLSFSTNQLSSLLPTLLGNHSLPYPPYSSRTVDGIPLYKYARENRLHEIEIPVKKVMISSFALLSSSLPDDEHSFLPLSELLSYISRIIPIVRGNFRQEEIVQKWHDSSFLFPAMFPRFDFRIACSSGTYVRGIVNELGEKLGIPTVTYSIKRTRIGEYTLKDALTL